MILRQFSDDFGVEEILWELLYLKKFLEINQFQMYPKLQVIEWKDHWNFQQEKELEPLIWKYQTIKYEFLIYDILENENTEISKFNISYSKVENMFKIMLIAVLIGFSGISYNQAYSQEIGLSTFQESAQVIIDEKISQTQTASITLLSTNIQEIRIPVELEEKMRNNERIQAIVITNENNCVLGVTNQSCILINIERNPEDKGINAIQESSKEIGRLFIDEVNQVFDTNAEFFQIYIHSNAETNELLDTSGVVSGGGTVSAVYTMPMEDTDSMYGKLSSMLISKSIRENGGFFDVAKTLATDPNAKMSFSIIPTESKTLLQLRVSTNTPIENEIKPGTEINPLDFFKINELA